MKKKLERKESRAYEKIYIFFGVRITRETNSVPVNGYIDTIIVDNRRPPLVARGNSRGVRPRDDSVDLLYQNASKRKREIEKEQSVPISQIYRKFSFERGTGGGEGRTTRTLSPKKVSRNPRLI